MEESIYTYRSGENAVSLQEQNGKYTVITNGSPVLSTSVFPEALSKYYRDISTISDAQQSNHDMAMTLFGNEVVKINRVIIPRLAQLGHLKEASYVKMITKQLEDVIKFVPPREAGAWVPSYNDGDMNQGTSETNMHPSRIIDGKLKRVKLHQASTGMMQPYNEFNDVPHSGVEKPVKISNTYQQKVKTREQRPIEGGYFEPSYLSKSEERMSKDEAFAIGQQLGVDFNKVDLNELTMGIPNEFEHKDVIDHDKIKAAKIALAHLREVPDYYTKLHKYVEKSLRKEAEKMVEGEQAHQNMGLENKQRTGRSQPPISGGKMEKAAFSPDAPKVVTGETQEPIEIRKEGIGSFSVENADYNPEIDNNVGRPKKLVLRQQLEDGGDVEENKGEFFKNSKDFYSLKSWIGSIIEEKHGRV